MALRYCVFRRTNKHGKPTKRGDYVQRKCAAENFGHREWSKWTWPMKIRAKDKAAALKRLRAKHGKKPEPR
jgi:hypothetical protein